MRNKNYLTDLFINEAKHILPKAGGGSGGGSSGGVSSWNDLTDKPFGDKVVPPPITFNPDTDITDNSVWFADVYIKVSDSTFAVEDLIGGTLAITGPFGDYLGNKLALHAGNTYIRDGLTAVVVDGIPLIVVITAETAALAGAEPGTYFMCDDSTAIVASLTLPERVTKIDPMYLPNTEWDNIVNKPFGRAGGIDHEPIEFNPDTDVTDETPRFSYGGYELCKVSDDVFEKSHLIGATMYGNGQYMIDGRAIPDEEGIFKVGPNGELLLVWNNSWAYIAVLNEDAAAKCGTQPGTYFANTSGKFVVTRLEFQEVVKKIDEKYMPDTIARVSDIECMIGDAIGGSY